MGPRKGSHIWIPCEVKSGPFPDERVVHVQSDAGDAYAFVRTDYLKETIVEGETCVRALIVEVRGNTFVAELPGQAITSKEFEGELARVT